MQNKVKIKLGVYSANDGKKNTIQKYAHYFSFSSLQKHNKTNKCTQRFEFNESISLFLCEGRAKPRGVEMV